MLMSFFNFLITITGIFKNKNRIRNKLLIWIHQKFVPESEALFSTVIHNSCTGTHDSLGSSLLAGKTEGLPGSWGGQWPQRKLTLVGKGERGGGGVLLYSSFGVNNLCAV